MQKLLASLICGSLIGLGPAVGQTVSQTEVGRAQYDMIRRVEEHVKLFAKTIGLEAHWISFCHHELHLKIRGHPTDGHMHFGIDYNKISSADQLRAIINSREIYERSFIVLCLANAKRALQEASAGEVQGVRRKTKSRSGSRSGSGFPSNYPWPPPPSPQ